MPRMGMRFRPRFTGPRRFSLGRRPKYRAIVHTTKNKGQITIGPTTAGTEAITAIVEGVEAPANRFEDVPAGCIVRKVVVHAHPTTMVTGKHQAMLLYRPAAENLATPIASYFDVTDPLTEEGVKMRRLAMSPVKTFHTDVDAGPHAGFRFTWKGAKRMYDGDSIDLAILDADTATTYDVQQWITFTQ